MKHIELPKEIEEYPQYQKYEKFLRFYEELEYCSKEFKKLIDIVTILLKNNSNTLNKETQRNYEIINFNFNYLQAMMNLFKFDQTKKIENVLIRIYLIRLYIYVIEEFGRLRKNYDNFFYFSKDEENRYLENLRVLVKENVGELNLYPSKVGFYFLRYIRFYIFKINKYIFRNDSEKRIHKLSFYVI